MKRLRWQLVIVFIALVAIALLLLSQQPGVLPGIVEPVVQPTSGGAYSEALVGSLQRLNPMLDWYNQPDQDVDRLLYCRLMAFDERAAPVGEVVETYGISADGMTYNFSIRENAVWHDGEPVTSDDVIYTAGLLADPDLPAPDDLKAMWAAIEVIPLDDKTFQMVLPEPFGPFLDYLTFGLLPAHLLDGTGVADLMDAAFNLNPVGCGPYRFDHFLSDEGAISGVVLKTFADYFAQPAYIEEVTFKTYPDAAAALTAYQTGDVLGVSELPPETLPQGLNETNLNLYTARLPRLELILFNLNDPELPFLQDSQLRQALMLGLNRQRIIDHILGGQAIPAYGPIFPGTWAYYENTPQTAFDPERAINILKQEGYNPTAGDSSLRAKEGEPALEFELIHPDQAPYPEIAAAIQEDWAHLGVKLTLTPLPYAELVNERLAERDFSAALVDLDFTGQHDPDPYVFWHDTQKTSGQNYTQWVDRQASEYLEQGRIKDDLGERARLYRNFQVRFSTELPALPLFYPVYTYGIDQSIQGASIGPLSEPSDRLASLPAWFLEARLAAPTAAPEITATP